MLITSHPASRNQLDSARVEKRGPWMTTTVPAVANGDAELARRLDEQAAQVGTVGIRRGDVGCLGPVVERILPRPRPVDELIADDELAELEVGLQRARGVRADDAAYPELLHRPDIGPVGDPVRRELVPAAVAREKGDSGSLDFADR